MANKHVLLTADAEYVRHQIGNPIFAIETNLQTLKRRMEGVVILDGHGLIASMEKSIETLKQRLHDLDVAPDTEIKFEEFKLDEESGIELLTIDEFKKGVQCNAYTDDDGAGFLATTTLDNHNRTMESNQRIAPSEIASGKVLPVWATHVAWYSK